MVLSIMLVSGCTSNNSEMVKLSAVDVSKKFWSAFSEKNYKLAKTFYTSEKSFMEEVKKFALNISKGSPIAFSLAKQLLKDSYSNDLKTHLENEAKNIIETAGTEDFQEGINSFFEKRYPNFKGK